MTSNWTQQEAIELCTRIEAICPNHGCHVALTGGLLYKDGERKDCDLVLYRIRQVAEIDFEGLKTSLAEIGFTDFEPHGYWLTKAKYQGKTVDFFRPESQSTPKDDDYNKNKETPTPELAFTEGW